jgi:hypothetical protein
MMQRIATKQRSKNVTMMLCNKTKQAMLQDTTDCNKFMAIAIRGQHLRWQTQRNKRMPNSDEMMMHCDATRMGR